MGSITSSTHTNKVYTLVKPMIVVTSVEDPVDSMANRFQNVTDVWVEDVIDSKDSATVKKFTICATQITTEPTPPRKQRWNWVLFSSNGQWRERHGPWDMEDLYQPKDEAATVQDVYTGAYRGDDEDKTYFTQAPTPTPDAED